MGKQDTNRIRIGIRTQTACHLKLTAVSDPNASYGSLSDKFWIEAPLTSRHLFLSVRFSKDVAFTVSLGGRALNDEKIPLILYRRLTVNDEELLPGSVATETTPYVVKCNARAGAIVRMLIEWDLPAAGSPSISPHAFRHSLINRPVAAASETAEEKTKRLEKWSLLNSSLENAHRLLQPVEYVVLDSKKLVYIVNSKVANTSIKCSMVDEFFDDDYSVHRALTDRGISKTALNESQLDYYKFTFVRNPFSRLVSCYISKYHADRNIYKKEGGDFVTYLDGYLKEDEGFERFVEKVCEIPHRLMDRHFRLQYDIVYTEEGSCRCDYVGKFEQLNNDFAPLKEAYHLQDLPHYNRTCSEKWMRFYTTRTAQMVYEKYRKDFAAFGYQEEYARLLSFLSHSGRV